MKRLKTKEQSTESIIDQAVKILKKDGVVVFPSDTVYGLLVDATSSVAVEKLISIKSRPAGRAISVFMSDIAMIGEYVETNHDQIKMLKSLLPGPYTIVLPSKHKVSSLLESEQGSLGVRLPHYKLITDLVTSWGKPLTATSANVSGKSSCYLPDAFLNQLSSKKGELVDLIVDAGSLPHNKPSTVVDLTTSDIKILRQGDVDIKSAQSFVSESEDETKKIARDIFQKSQKHLANKSLIFILEGDLGAGKTVFVKGIGETLGVDRIISPTFVIYYEYDVTGQATDTLVHADFYNIQDASEFEHLGLEKYLKPRVVMCIEWGEKSGPVYEALKKKGHIVHIKIEHVDKKTRKIEVY